VAIGCVALDGPGFIDSARDLVRPDGPGAFSGLDEVIRSLRVVSGGQHAARLRELRRFAGPVPPWYPDTRPVAGPIRDVRGIVWRGAGLVTGFGERLIATAATLRHGAALPLVSAPQLAWGARYRPSPSKGHVTIRLPLNRRLARRTWMCLPGLPGPGTAIAEVSSTATAMEQQIWRGIHEGAHLDHLSSMARLRRPMAPSPGEFGAGLLVAESYAMAVELLAGVECILAGEGHAVAPGVSTNTGLSSICRMLPAPSCRGPRQESRCCSGFRSPCCSRTPASVSASKYFRCRACSSPDSAVSMAESSSAHRQPWSRSAWSTSAGSVHRGSYVAT